MALGSSFGFPLVCQSSPRLTDVCFLLGPALVSALPSVAAASLASVPATRSPRPRPSSGSRTASTALFGKYSVHGCAEGPLWGCVFYDESIKKAGVSLHCRSALKCFLLPRHMDRRARNINPQFQKTHPLFTMKASRRVMFSA